MDSHFGFDDFYFDVMLPPPFTLQNGAAAALPCPAGKRKDVTLAVMDSESDCIICPEGTFCPVGSALAQPCAPGTYNAQPQQETCAKCAAGTFQALEGKTACDACTDGCERSRTARNDRRAHTLLAELCLVCASQTTVPKALPPRCRVPLASARTQA